MASRYNHPRERLPNAAPPATLGPWQVFPPRWPRPVRVAIALVRFFCALARVLLALRRLQRIYN